VNKSETILHTESGSFSHFFVMLPCKKIIPVLSKYFCLVFKVKYPWSKDDTISRLVFIDCVFYISVFCLSALEDHSLVLTCIKQVKKSVQQDKTHTHH